MTRPAHPLLHLHTRGREAVASPSRAPGRADRRPRVVPLPPAGTPADSSWPELTLHVRRDRARPVVVVSGELDLVGQELLEAVLAHVRATESGKVEVDLGRVTFANTHGLSPALGRDVVLVAASPAVTRLLRLLGLPVPRSRPQRRAPGRSGRGGEATGPG